MKRPLAEVQADHTAALMAIPGVTALYLGALPDGRPCLTVGVAARTAAIVRAVPRVLEGWPVVIVETGPIAPR